MIWPLLAILTVILLLLLSAPLLKGGRYSKPLISVFFIGFLTLSICTYAVIGRPDLLQEGALKPYAPPPGPAAEHVQAAQEMSVEDRAEMILNMVESLAAKLEDNPADPQGWAQLIRARRVLGQTKKLQADIKRVELIFVDNPETVQKILADN